LSSIPVWAVPAAMLKPRFYTSTAVQGTPTVLFCQTQIEMSAFLDRSAASF
jgi:hypothetical protein